MIDIGLLFVDAIYVCGKVASKNFCHDDWRV